MKSVNAIVAILFAMVMAFSIGLTFEIPALAVFTVLVVGSFLPRTQGALAMALQKEIWRGDIVGQLFKDNPFAMHAVNADPFVLAGAVVHIPVAGAPTQVKKNLNVFPQVATERADNELTYPLDTFYALPRRIPQLDNYELSYDKRMSVVGEDISKLVQVAMDGLLFTWGPLAGNTILTTGADTALDRIDGTATGTRKMFTKDEFKRIAKLWSRGNLTGNKFAMLTASHYYQFFDSLSEAERTDIGRVANVATGVVGQYMGITILMRSDALRYRGADGAYVKVDENDAAFAPSATDRAASLFWTDTSVERALGEVDVFDNQGQALYYGDIFSAMLRMGGRIRRVAGVYAVVEAIGA